jgi:hypothetical protein
VSKIDDEEYGEENLDISTKPTTNKKNIKTGI